MGSASERTRPWCEFAASKITAVDRAHPVDVQDSRGHELDMLGQGRLVVFRLRGEAMSADARRRALARATAAAAPPPCLASLPRTVETWAVVSGGHASIPSSRVRSPWVLQLPISKRCLQRSLQRWCHLMNLLWLE